MNARITTPAAVLAIVVGIGLFFFLRFYQLGGLYLSTDLSRAGQTQTTITQCGDLCTASCQGFSSQDQTNTCQAQCQVLCEKNY